MYVEKMKTAIEEQIAKEYEYSPVRGCAAQLIDIVAGSEEDAKLVCEDFENKLTVKGCEAKIKAWVDKNHKGNSGWCPHHIAEGIIRKYFGLGSAEAVSANKPAEKPKQKVISFADALGGL